MALPTNLSGLTPREAVADAMYRAIYGADTNDYNLFASAWAKDTPDSNTFTRPLGNETLDMTGMTEINEKLWGPLSKLDTHHTLGNVRVDIKDDGKTAYLTTYSLAQHHRLGEGPDVEKKGMLAGTTYFVDIVKEEDGVWRMKKWAVGINWLEGDLSIVA